MAQRANRQAVECRCRADRHGSGSEGRDRKARIRESHVRKVGCGLSAKINCHPERRRHVRECERDAESKDPVQLDAVARRCEEFTLGRFRWKSVRLSRENASAPVPTRSSQGVLRLRHGRACAAITPLRMTTLWSQNAPVFSAILKLPVVKSMAK